MVERHRHRYEFNNSYREACEKEGMVFSGESPNKALVEVVELKSHPWFVGCQFHPELTSKPTQPHPLFMTFVAEASSRTKRKVSTNTQVSKKGADVTAKTQALLVGKAVFSKEAAALNAVGDRLGANFEQAVSLMRKVTGRVIVTGLGKSGHVARKIASTLSSTGTPALFLHPSEALHGDFGMITAGDLLLAIAYGGETREVVAVAEFACGRKLPVVALTGNPSSALGRFASCVCLMLV